MSSLATNSHAQQLGLKKTENPVYLADSPTASDSLIQIQELLRLNNLDQAVLLVDQTITNFGHRLIESDQPGVYILVRDRVNQFVLAHPDLLDACRRLLTPSAQTQLLNDQWQTVYSTRWFTKPGYTASLHHAQTLIENAHFDEGIRSLQSLKSHPDHNDANPSYSRLLALASLMIDQDQSNTKIHNATSSLQWNTQTHSAQQSQTINLTGIVPEALATESITPKSEIGQLKSFNQPRLTGANWDPTSWVMPAADADHLYTNDGITISCFDRFTLRPIWRFQPARDMSELPITQDERARLGRVIEDASSITLIDQSLYLASGIARNGERAGDQRLFKLDANTGQTQWAVDVQSIDPALTGTSIRGHVIVDQDVVIIGARTNNRQKRLISFAIIGLDSATGKTKWIQHIASAGALPFQQMGQLAHSAILDQGTIYWTDQIGLAFAIQAATGQVQWVRSLPSPDVYSRSNRPSFANSTPVITDRSMFTLTSDGSTIIELNKHTGEIMNTRPADPVGEALYLLSVGDMIACVSPNRVYFYSTERFATTNPRKSALLGGTRGIRGRVVVHQDQLFIPTATGIEIITSQRPLASTSIPLGHTGNILALNGQIIVVDEMNISSYLSWETTQSFLQSRIKDDPAAAITLTQLAFRANKPNETIQAANQAINIISSLDRSSKDLLRIDLFHVLEEMLPHFNLAKDQALHSSTLSGDHQHTILNHLATLATTHEQVVSHRIALGRWNENNGTKNHAIRAYQDILDQPALSRAMWEGSSIAVRGGIEATRQIGNVLEAAGYQPYESFNIIAQSERSFLSDSPPSQQLEALAQQYPWAKITPALWLEVAQIANNNHQLTATTHASKKGIERAIALKKLGVQLNQSTIDHLAELAITGMISSNQTHDAQNLAYTIGLVFKDLTLRIDGQVITQDQIVAKAKLANHTPALGDKFLRSTNTLLIAGNPIEPAVRIDRGGTVVHSPQNGIVEYIRIGRGASETIWSRQSENQTPPSLPWQDEQQTILLWPTDHYFASTGTLESINTTTGKTDWIIYDIRTILSDESQRIPDDMARVDGMFDTPLVGVTPLNQLLITTDGHTIIVSDRIGRAMGIDQRTGDILWNNDLPANRIFDLDLNGSTLGICGVMTIDQPNLQQDGAHSPIAASINPRTGEITQLIDHLGEFPRWIRADSHGNLILGTFANIISLEPASGSINWVYNDDLLEETQGAWIANNQLVVEDANNTLWTFNLDQADPSAKQLELRHRLNNQSWVRVRPTLDSLLIASDKGFAAFDQSLELIATDPMNTLSKMIDVAWGLDHLVMIQEPRNDLEHARSELFLLDHHTGKLLDVITLSLPSTIHRSPKTLTAITGGVIVGYHEISVFVPTTMPTESNDSIQAFEPTH